MKKINLTKEELDSLIKKNYRVDKNSGYISNAGSFGIVLPYEGDLGLKILAPLAVKGYFDEDALEENISPYHLISPRQIEYLSEKQSKIKLSSLPEGVAYYNDKAVAIILRYFNNHKNLLELYNEDSTIIISILEKVLYAVRELMENDIYQMDVKESNFLYSQLDYKVEPIDLDGPLIKVAHNDIMREEIIYENMLEMFAFLIKQKLNSLLNNNELKLEEYNERLAFMENLKHGIYIYESLILYLKEVKKNNILEKSKKYIKQK